MKYDSIETVDARKTVLVIGDVMLDSFIYGSVNRISPEASTPIMNASREVRMLGGAANVAAGVAALGARVILVSVTGADPWASQIASECSKLGIEARLLHDTGRETTRKIRFVSEEHSTHMLRLDWERTNGLSDASERITIESALKALKYADCVVLSDYDKGVLTSRVIRAVIDQARHARVPILVDPKKGNVNIYEGCDYIKPNRKELGRTCATEQDFIEAATTLGAQLKAKGVLVTRGDQGMTLYRQAMPPIHLPAHRVRVRDVSGAGDTVLASLAVSLACDLTIEQALKLANDAAAIAVGKLGTAVVTRDELFAPKGKIVRREAVTYDGPNGTPWPLLDQRLAEWKHMGLRVGFTNGCFDLIHPGHVKLLTEARAACDRLIVGLNSDHSVRALKGETRPIQNWNARADVLSAIDGVDLVVEFDSALPRDLIERIKPSVIVKGSDYRAEDVCGHDIAAIKIVECLPGISTTRLAGKL